MWQKLTPPILEYKSPLRYDPTESLHPPIVLNTISDLNNNNESTHTNDWFIWPMPLNTTSNLSNNYDSIYTNDWFIW